MRVALAQLNPTVGDVAGNTRAILDALDQARRDRADVLVTGELALIGYPPRDLLFRQGVVEACEQAVVDLARAARDITVIVGHPRRAAPGGLRPFRNSASVCRDGEVIATYDKRLFPGYDVFDEDRYFEPGEQTVVITVAERRLGLLICEDLWRAEDTTTRRAYHVDPALETVRRGCDVLISLNATPFVLGKHQRRVNLLQTFTNRFGLPAIAVHQVGANDDLIFDGRSVAVNANGVIVDQLPAWEPSVRTIDLAQGGAQEIDEATIAEIWFALVLGVRDYCHKTGNSRVVIGLSGGIDSAVTACIAAAALGAGNVRGVALPSRYTVDDSTADARELAARLGCESCDLVSIEQAHDTIHKTLAQALPGAEQGVTDENIQARLRGLLLMAISNQTGALLLATGNKSELAAGYCTMYGDMNGALSVIGDVLKTQVYELARWINDNHARCGFATPPIPQRSITRAPSAELRPDQTDQDTLPPYAELDRVIDRFINLEQSAEQIIEETDLDANLVHEIRRMIDRAQYKREQAAIVLKVSPRAFGRGRPMPVAMRWQPETAGASAGDEASPSPSRRVRGG